MAGAVVGTMRAAPTFVVMFFLLNVIPPDATLLGLPLALSDRTIVALSLVPYAVAYVADNGREAVLQLRRGATESALLFLPNLVRAFLVLVMSSGAGAAIGVSRGCRRRPARGRALADARREARRLRQRRGLLRPRLPDRLRGGASGAEHAGVAPEIPNQSC